MSYLWSKYSFTIKHYYYIEAVVPPACNEKGYTRYACKHCAASYDSDFISMSGHKYIETTIHSSCTVSGGIKHSCMVCGYEYLTNPTYAYGHNYDSAVIRVPTCTKDGQLYEKCEYCGDEQNITVPALGHNYIIVEVTRDGKITKRKMECTHCLDSYIENLGNQYEKVASYMELIFNAYRPYIVWVFVCTAGVWSIFIGISYMIAHKNDDKEKARRMLVNYIIGLIAIFAILVACPYLIRGITALVI